LKQREKLGQMNNNIFSLIFLKIINYLLATAVIAITLMCPLAIAETIQINDQFGNPIENVVVSFSANEPIESDKSNVLIMDQIDKQFAPKVLVVHKNQTVSFPNSDNIRHHLYSFSTPKPFEFKMFKGGESKQLTFDQAGIVVLGCNIHDQMVGYIYVADHENTVITNKQGIAELPQGGLAVKLWHSKLSANKIARVEVQLPPANSAQPWSITLNLLAEIKAPTNNKFKSKKFSRGNQ
jgi:plastocyanin